MDTSNIHISHMHDRNLHTSGTRLSDVAPTPPTASFPAYYLGRPVAMYQRRYRRHITANGRSA